MAYKGLKHEVLKQAIDQPLHFLWAFLAALPLALVAGAGRDRKWTTIAVAWFAGNAAFIVTREVFQWPSSRPWDPYLDWSFFVLGAAGAAAVWWWRRRR